MSDKKIKIDQKQIDELYDESNEWHINTGGETIHAKRIAGKYRSFKWLAASVWLIFFIGPYFRWNGEQAILLDIPARQFHIFDITILPQDVWMLSLVLLFFAILLAIVTSVAGRVYCGYFCFQTIWVDIFTLLEAKLEGSPAQRNRLDKAPWTLKKIRIKSIKHAVWIAIGLLTGIGFCAWFTDAYQLWVSIFTLSAAIEVWISLLVFTGGTYLFAGFMREQVCLWLCPYARIQGVMYDQETILPTYDVKRGEPRGKLNKRDTAAKKQGDCINCNLCVAVCPTGVDIRQGQQEGCITCGLCLDACDSIMDKIDRPRGLIRYTSLDEVEGKKTIPVLKRPRVIIYALILLLSLVGIGYGLTHLGSVELQVLHERQPLYVLRSDGSIQNKYELKILNKTDKPLALMVSVTGPKDLIVAGVDDVITIGEHQLVAKTLYVRINKKNIKQENSPVLIRLQSNSDPDVWVEYDSMFISPSNQ